MRDTLSHEWDVPGGMSALGLPWPIMSRKASPPHWAGAHGSPKADDAESLGLSLNANY